MDNIYYWLLWRQHIGCGRIVAMTTMFKNAASILYSTCTEIQEGNSHKLSDLYERIFKVNILCFICASSSVEIIKSVTISLLCYWLSGNSMIIHDTCKNLSGFSE